jgi:hypothetical protein
MAAWRLKGLPHTPHLTSGAAECQVQVSYIFALGLRRRNPWRERPMCSVTGPYSEGIGSLTARLLPDTIVAEQSHKVTVRLKDVWINPEYFWKEA